jgi:hypothetical protein
MDGSLYATCQFGLSLSGNETLRWGLYSGRKWTHATYLKNSETMHFQTYVGINYFYYLDVRNSFLKSCHTFLKHCVCVYIFKNKNYPCKRPWRPLHFLDYQITDDSEVVRITCRPPFTYRKIRGTLISVRGGLTPWPKCSWKDYVNWKI